jgi:hypothetical protein
MKGGGGGEGRRAPASGECAAKCDRGSYESLGGRTDVESRGRKGDTQMNIQTGWTVDTAL